MTRKVVTVSSAALTLKVLPELGASVLNLRAASGRPVQLRATTPDGLTQHGDVRNRPWTVTREDAAHLRCTFDSRAFAARN